MTSVLEGGPRKNIQEQGFENPWEALKQTIQEQLQEGQLPGVDLPEQFINDNGELAADLEQESTPEGREVRISRKMGELLGNRPF